MKKIYLTITGLIIAYNAFAQTKFPAAGIAIYNTFDTTFNYERVRSAWGSNIFTANSESAGSGTVTRSISFAVNAGIFSINNVATSGVISAFDFNRTGGHGLTASISGTLESTGYQQTGLAIFPTIAQSGAAGFTGLYVAPYETSVGTGNNYLIDAGVNTASNGGGTHTPKFLVSDGGVVTVSGTVDIGPTGTGALLSVNRGRPGINLGTVGTAFDIGTGTDNATDATGTYALNTGSSFRSRTFTSNNTVTYTNAPTLYIDGPPRAGTNVTITNPWAMYVNNGNSCFQGNVLIAKTSQINTTYKLDVGGNVRANEIVVNTSGADFVFAPSYMLQSLLSLKKYIDHNHHLPEIAPAKQMQAEGLNVGENQTKLLQKVEELTLYLIEKDKEIKEQQQTNLSQQKQIDLLKQQMNEITKLLKKN